ncbi:DUF1630-domain-containing protein [Testicularia cyperi]|uniref:DUF1630-domain-containing protein n=1 Tax=Testicularia cyperi TaxID=1882483 RepID=A0A317XWF1_9BASI|nr:DUF1630-domain-containing protein [Testicularia cyperi]
MSVASESSPSGQRYPVVGDGDLGLVGIDSRSPSTSFEVPSGSQLMQNSPSRTLASSAKQHDAQASPGSLYSASVSPAAKLQHSRLVKAEQGENRSMSDLSSNYLSAEESPVPKPNELPEAAGPSQPPAVTSHNSMTSVSTVIPDSLPASHPAMLQQRQAVSVEQELDADDSSTPPPEGTEDPSRRRKATRSRRSSRRSNLPPLQNRLPVGEGGPRAPPRSASFRGDPSKRYSESVHGHGDLGVEALQGAFSGGHPSPSMTSFLDLESPRTSTSSSRRRSIPDRRTSLHLSPNSSRLNSPTKPPVGSVFSPGTAPPSPRNGKAIHSTPGTPGARPSSSSSSAAPNAPLRLDREAMQRWVLSVGCVNFDLELGPDLEFLYPPLGISREERDNIAFSSFPDTSIFDDGFSVFSWRVREVPLDSSGSEPPTIKSLSESLQAATMDDEETPRPSINKVATQSRMAAAAQKLGKKTSSAKLSVPTSPTSPSTSGFRDSSASSATSSHGLSRQASDANMQGSSPASSHLPSSFHERLTQKLFSSGGSSMSRNQSHDRHSSTHSMSSVASAEEGVEDSPASLSVSTATTTTDSGSVAGVTTSTRSTDMFAPRRAGNSTSSSYIYGYVFFRQKPDAKNKRGYFQKSVVILSHLPYVGLFSEVVSRLGPLYFEFGMSMFETFANDIINWPAPTPGTILTLPLLGSIITAAIPFGQQPQNSPNAEAANAFTSPTGSSAFRNAATMTIRSRVRQTSHGGKRELPEPLIGPEGPLLASIPSTSLFDTFREALSDLWVLWECVLLAEPILVIGPDPKAASEAVWHMLDLIRPIPFAGDFRPYFHIHDYDFRTLVTKNKPQAGTLIAATNPFFATACSHWPNLLRVGKPAVKLIHIKHGSASGAKKVGGGNGPIGGGIGGGHGAGGGGPDHIPGFTTKRKRRISKDRQLLKKLQDLAASCSKSEKEGGTADAAACNSANILMRRYFADLTERFLAPLNRYVASLVPANFDLASPSEAPKIRPFNTTDFLASLKVHGTPLALRSRSLPTGAAVRQSLYTDFLKCPNFSLWLHSRVAAAEEEQRRRYIATLIQGDVTTFGHTRGEIETIDLYSRLVEEIRLVDVQLTSPTEPGPGSRWRTDKPSLAVAAAKASVARKYPSENGAATDSPGSVPMSAVPSSMSEKVAAISASGRSTPTLQPTTEKRLLDQKHRLMVQLDKLCQTLPDDLRSSLRRPA